MADHFSSTSEMTRSFTIVEMSGVAAAERMMAEQRATTVHAPAVKASTVDSGGVLSGNGEMFEWVGAGGGRAAGVNVTPETAMRMAAVWRCVTLIAGAMMCSPLGVYERTGDGGQRRLDDHPYSALLTDEVDDETSAPEFVELETMAVMLRGNGYALIRQARNGVITSIDYYHPNDVTPYRSGGTVWYRFTNVADGSQEIHHQSYVLHFRGPGRRRDGLMALSPISYHAQTIGVGLATRDYTAGQFERGLMTNDFFSFPKDVTPTQDQRSDFKEYIRRRAQGVANSHNPLILENGAEWKRVAITAKDAQLLELLQYTAVDVARIFGVPPHMIGETDKSTSWGTGIEQLSKGFDRYSVRPHKIRFAKELSRKLFASSGSKRSPLFVSFENADLMDGDSKSIAEYLRAALGGNQLPGWISQNSARRLVGEPPIEGGDEVYTPTGAPADPSGGDPAPKPDPKKEPGNES